MKIYVNNQNYIMGVDNVPNEYVYCYEVEGSRSDFFGAFCDNVISCYKYEEVVSETDKSVVGYSIYTTLDFYLLLVIQKQYEDSQRQYEDSQRQVQALNAQIEYLSMMSGIETEVVHE